MALSALQMSAVYGELKNTGLIPRSFEENLKQPGNKTTTDQHFTLHSSPPSVQSLYSSAGCLFLLDQSDSIASYEARAASLPTSHESAMTAFSTSLDRVHQVEALHRKSGAVQLCSFIQRGGEPWDLPPSPAILYETLTSTYCNV